MEMMMKPRSHDVIQRMIPPLAVWAVGKMLEVPRVQRALDNVDKKFYATKRIAERRAANNRAWLAAGAAAFIIGISFMARATKK
jgi:hypothetical protein